MDAKEWVDTYYPVEAEHCSRADALDHSILKWTGLVEYPEADRWLNTGTESCALCWLNPSCNTCDIKLAVGYSCAVQPPVGLSPWAEWVRNQNPKPMLDLLLEVKRIKEGKGNENN